MLIDLRTPILPIIKNINITTTGAVAEAQPEKQLHVLWVVLLPNKSCSISFRK